MEALLPSFIAAAFAEFGDKTQLLALALASAWRRPGPVLAGLVAAAFVSCVAAAYAGTLIHGTITLRAGSLFLGMALLYAGGAGLIGAKQPKPVTAGTAPLALIAFIVLLAGELGDKSQFLAVALAAQSGSLWLVGVGAAVGICAVDLPLLTLAHSGARLPLRAIRTSAALLFLLSGTMIALRALRLI